MARLAAICALFAGLLLPAAAAASGRVAVGAASAPIDGARAIGPARGSTRLDVRVTLRPRSPAALEAFVRAVSDPASPRQGQYLTRGAFAERFGPTDAAIRRVRGGLRRAGLRPGRLSPSHLTLRVRTTVAAARRAFAVRIVRVRLADGRIALANPTAPTLPAGAAGPIEGVSASTPNPIAAAPATSSPAARAPRRG